MTEKTPYQQPDQKATLARMLRAIANELDQPDTVLAPGNQWMSVTMHGQFGTQQVTMDFLVKPSNPAFLIAAGGQG